jgi:hypothetical protein
MTLDGSVGEIWKSLRKSMSPTFTSGKLKGMLEPMGGTIDKMIEHVRKEAAKGGEVEVKPLFEGEQKEFDFKLEIGLLYCTINVLGMALDVIAKCAFGIDTDAHRNPDELIVKEGRAAFGTFVPNNWFDTVMMSIPLFYFPSSVKYLPIFPPAFKNLWNITNRLNNNGVDSLAEFSC